MKEIVPSARKTDSTREAHPTDNLQPTTRAALLELHLLDAHAAGKGQSEAALLDRLVRLDFRELVARLVAVAFRVLELRRQVGLLVDVDSEVAHALCDRLALRIEIEN